MAAGIAGTVAAGAGVQAGTLVSVGAAAGAGALVGIAGTAAAGAGVAVGVTHTTHITDTTTIMVIIMEDLLRLTKAEEVALITTADLQLQQITEEVLQITQAAETVLEILTLV